jgi:hypothetical protein
MMTVDPTPMLRPEVTDLGVLSGAALRADSEQQQQQQQQQQASRQVRRFLNAETSLPQEEVVHKLTTEIRQTNTIAPRAQ